MDSVRPLAETLGAPRHINDVQFAAGTRLYFGLRDELVLSIIPADQTIKGVPCGAGPVRFHPSGSLASATLGSDFEYQGMRLQAGSHVSWDDDGTVKVRVAQDHDHDFGDVAVPGSGWARLCEEGSLLCWTQRIGAARPIQGVPCQAGSIVTTRGNGNLERVTLGEDHAIGGLVGLVGTDMEFHDAGQVAVITLAEATRRGDVDFAPGTTLVLRQDGTVSVALLAESASLFGESVPAGTTLHFDGDERLTARQPITWEVTRQAYS